MKRYALGHLSQLSGYHKNVVSLVIVEATLNMRLHLLTVFILTGSSYATPVGTSIYIQVSPSDLVLKMIADTLYDIRAAIEPV